jgi:hypothetical protein
MVAILMLRIIIYIRSVAVVCFDDDCGCWSLVTMIVTMVTILMMHNSGDGAMVIRRMKFPTMAGTVLAVDSVLSNMHVL